MKSKGRLKRYTGYMYREVRGIKHLTAYALFLSITGCSLYPTEYRLGLYHQTAGAATGKNPIGIIEVDQKLTKSTGCKYIHKSYLTEGNPFNDRYEDTFDAIGCYVEFR